MITRAYKGNVTVAIEQDLYIKKVELSLADKKYYLPVKLNPIKIVREKMTNLLEIWERRGLFECDCAFRCVSTQLNNTLIPKAYALIKIHKKDFPVRIIVSATNSPTYSFDKSLFQLFNKHFTKPSSSLKNSLILKDILDDTIMPDNYNLVSFDVVSLFSNIPRDLYIIVAISSKWRCLNNELNLSKQEFLEGIETLIDCPYLQFNNKFYNQIMGAPLGFVPAHGLLTLRWKGSSNIV